ncbi:unnamed protein product [Callosobruchus maculatus]|uniref:Uncharacterized protein n=1 Tax=Callosobruchus maculatus TaxID=64391 RepID=A0A653BLN2_CALMS|nr:unnamed protein product [Callosobruchus maculatus]
MDYHPENDSTRSDLVQYGEYWKSFKTLRSGVLATQSSEGKFLEIFLTKSVFWATEFLPSSSKISPIMILTTFSVTENVPQAVYWQDIYSVLAALVCRVTLTSEEADYTLFQQSRTTLRHPFAKVEQLTRLKEVPLGMSHFKDNKTNIFEIGEIATLKN